MEKIVGRRSLTRRSVDIPVSLPAVRQVPSESRAESSDTAPQVGVRRSIPGSKTLEVPQVEVSSIQNHGAPREVSPGRKGSKEGALQLPQKRHSGNSETGLLETVRSWRRTNSGNSETAVSVTAGSAQGSRETARNRELPSLAGRIVSSHEAATRRRCRQDVSVPRVPSRSPSHRSNNSGQDVQVLRVPSRSPSKGSNNSGQDVPVPVLRVPSRSPSKGSNNSGQDVPLFRVPSRSPSKRSNSSDFGETSLQETAKVSHDLPEGVGIISGRLSLEPPEVVCRISVQSCETCLPETATTRIGSSDVSVPVPEVQGRKLYRRSHRSDLSQPDTTSHRRERIVTRKKTIEIKASVAEKSRNSIEAWFQSWDLDGSGKIDFQEFRRIFNNLSLTWDEDEFASMMNQIDSNHDGEVDIREFADWVTDPSSMKTVSLDGWLGKVNLAELQKPLFDCFNQSDNDGFVSKDDFLKCYQIMTYCLKMHPDGKDEWPRNAEEELQAADKDNTGAITFHEFVDWQELLLKDSGIPNSYLPQLVEELVEALTVVLDVLNWDAKGMPVDSYDNVLQSSTEKLAAISRELYSAKKELLLQSFESDDMFDEEVDDDCGPNYSWCQLPKNALQVLLRKCAEDNGLLVPSCQTPHPPSHAPSSAAPSRKELFNVARRNALMRHCVTLAFGQVMLILPDCDRRQSEPASRWYAWLARSNKQGRKDDLFYVLETSNGRLDWNLLEDESQLDESQIEHKFKAMPSDLQIFALLATQHMVSLSSTENQLCWERVQEALTNAVGLDVISEEGLLSYISCLRAQAKQDLFENNELHELLEMSAPGKRLADAVNLHLEELKLSPYEVMAGLSEMEVLPVSEEAWAQIAQHELELSLQCS
ncbi:unnamed protein product [Polarella glacialis]|uniref:EF-hand domain-containing protein n=1 Tax=Polarella glacialis TaxID=89957 RepID=A0A813GKK6_POLGL|nr:unnamed protein product [Polarella glacialis]CAE8713722.1 unnamed protein product [Polarella glacialis]